jgi:hypothetical protein
MARFGTLVTFVGIFIGSIIILQILTDLPYSHQRVFLKLTTNDKLGKPRQVVEADDVFLLGVGKADITGYASLIHYFIYPRSGYTKGGTRRAHQLSLSLTYAALWLNSTSWGMPIWRRKAQDFANACTHERSSWPIQVIPMVLGYI